MSAKNLLYIVVCSISFVATFVTVYDLFKFLTAFENQQHHNERMCIKDCSNMKTAMFTNTILLLTFLLQHSLMATNRAKQAFNWLGLTTIERSLYILFTSLSLQIMIKLWIVVPDFQLWSVHDTILEWPLRIVHTYAWMVVYMGCITMDLVELLGVKQVYYAMVGLPQPLTYKSRKLQRLYLHMRHPSFISFGIILLASPNLTADRILLAVVWIAYMAGRWKIDAQDYSYSREQFKRKCHFFSQNNPLK